MNNTVKTIVNLGSLVGCFVVGMILQKYRDTINTPESTINKLNIAKQEANAAKEDLAEQTKKYNAEYHNLVSTKKMYQDEIRPSVEAAVRKELNDYIRLADEKYEKAKKENELATLKLQLYNRDRETNYYDVRIAEVLAKSK